MLTTPHFQYNTLNFIGFTNKCFGWFLAKVTTCSKGSFQNSGRGVGVAEILNVHFCYEISLTCCFQAKNLLVKLADLVVKQDNVRGFRKSRWKMLKPSILDTFNNKFQQLFTCFGRLLAKFFQQKTCFRMLKEEKKYRRDRNFKTTFMLRKIQSPLRVVDVSEKVEG